MCAAPLLARCAPACCLCGTLLRWLLAPLLLPCHCLDLLFPSAWPLLNGLCVLSPESALPSSALLSAGAGVSCMEGVQPVLEALAEVGGVCPQVCLGAPSSAPERC